MNKIGNKQSENKLGLLNFLEGSGVLLFFFFCGAIFNGFLSLRLLPGLKVVGPYGERKKSGWAIR